jgi:F-type H+-transporting ATPase subunit b
MSRCVIYCLAALTILALIASSAFASAPESGGEGGLNPLAPAEWRGDLAIWTAVVFLCLLAVLWKAAWKPIAEGLDKREHNIADQIAQAEAAHQKARDLLAEHERKLAAAQDEVRVILDQGRRDAESAGHELIDKAKAEAKTEYDRAAKQIDAAAAAAVKELAGLSANMAVELAGKIVLAQIKPGDHARLIEQTVAGFVNTKDDVSRN